MGVKVSLILLILASVALAAFGQVAMKKGMNAIGSLQIHDMLSTKLLSIASQPFVVIGFMLYIISAGIWLVVLSNADVSYAYPLVGLGYIVTAVLANLFFGESLTMFKVLGILMIMAGAFVVVSKF
ncbi:4-amino-4-deoxy-L-arabinose transferase [archaeon]|nr:MAG: 4-amino-4-deoxy-L-arabinose transferase [archaeon]